MGDDVVAPFEAALAGDDLEGPILNSKNVIETCNDLIDRNKLESHPSFIQGAFQFCGKRCG
jgi:hypothetical protein